MALHTKVNGHKKNIVILGAGYCGIQAARELARKPGAAKSGGGQGVKNTAAGNFQIVLVNRKSMHIYSADLYEIGTAYYPRITDSCLRDLAETAYIPLKTALKNLEICFVEDTITGIDYSGKKVLLQKSGELAFEYLVVTLGSVTNFYDLPGVAENAFPLKTVEDAMAIDCHLDELFKWRWQKRDESKVNLVVGGGGFTGVEFACELALFIRKLQRKYHFARNEVEIAVVQGSHELVGLGPQVSAIALRRFHELGVRAIFGARICSYHNGKLEICEQAGAPASVQATTRFIPADVLVWTAGIKPNPLLKSFEKLNPGGAIEVLPTLEAAHYPRVYAGGDNADIFDPAHPHTPAGAIQYLPKLGQLAVQEGLIIAENVALDIAGKPQKTFQPRFKGFIVALGGKYFVYHLNKITIAGILPWAIRRLIDLTYFAMLMPIGKALKKWLHTEKLYMQND